MGSSLDRPHVAGLRFRVFGRAVHPEWFSTRAHRRVAQDAWSADVRIVEGGHAVTWRAGDVRLTEILGDSTDAMPESGLLLESPIRHERTESIEPARGVEYQASFEVERLDPEVFAHLCDEMTLDAARDRLFHRSGGAASGGKGNRLAPRAISHVAFESRPRGLLVHTFHSFPDERAILRTQSLFEVDRLPR